MLSFTRKRLVTALVFFCCAVFALANFGLLRDGDAEAATHIDTTGAKSASNVTVLLPAVGVRPPPDTIAVPITIGDVSGLGVISYDLNIDFDPLVVTPAGGASCSGDACFTQAGTKSSGMLITPNTNNAGHFIISAFQVQSLSGAGTLLILNFDVIGLAAQSSPLTFSDYTDPGNILHPGFMFNESNPSVSLINGSIYLLDATPTNTSTPTATATPTMPLYSIFDIGVVLPADTASQGEGVSPAGIAVGRSFRPSNAGAQAFSYTGGGGIVGLPNLAARSYCRSDAATDNGLIVGTCATTAFGSSRLPTIWQGGAVSQLPLPAGETLGDAFDVNSSGVAVGSVNGGSLQRGAMYSGGTGSVITATTSNGSFFTTAFGVNDSGRIAGIGIDPNNAARNVPMVYDIGAGSAIDIGALPGFNSAIAFAIGNGGHVVGSSMLNQGSGLPFIWTQAGGMVAIPLAAGTTQGSARGVNTAGWAVGTDSSAFAIPFLYTGTATYRLADLIPSGTGWDLSTNTSSSAMGISDGNIIVGTGVFNGAVHAYTMVPAGQATPTNTPTATFTPMATATGTFTPTRTSTSTPTNTPTSTPTASAGCSQPPPNTVPITINDNAAGSAYPSNITVSGIGNTLTRVQVLLTGLSHSFPDDIDIMLVGPGGQNIMLMSDAGGDGDLVSANLGFSDQGLFTLPDETQISVGYYKPTNYDTTTDIFPPPAPTPATTTELSVFNGTNPNGTWSLYVRDDRDGDVGSISGGWSLGIVTTACSTTTPTSTPTATATATGTPSIQFSSATYIEDESQTAAITIGRTGDTSGTQSVGFSTSDGTAVGGAACVIGSGVDYVSVTGQTVIFNPGELSKTVNVTICADNITEPDQTVNLLLTGGNVGILAMAVLTINDTATTFRNSAGIAINGGGPGGLYPATIMVAGGPPAIGSMRLTIYDYATRFPDNVDFLLVGPTGQNIVLLADAGGLSRGGPVTLNFTDTAGAVVADNGPLVTGDFEPTSYGAVANFPAPAPLGPFNLPGGMVGGTGTQTLFGNFGGTNANGMWSLYLRDDSTVGGPFGNVAGWGIEFLASTAAGGSLSGRVLTANGQGIRNAKVVITGNSLVDPLVITTGSFGYFTFDGLATGETYVVTVNSQRYTFSTPSRVISLVDNVIDADFVADPLE